MKVSKANLILLAVIMVFATAFGFYWADSKNKRKMLNEMAKEKQSQIDLLTDNIGALNKSTVLLEEEIIESRQDLENLKIQFDAKEAEHAEEIDALKEAPPETLLAETQRILNTDEVWQEDDGKFSFSIAAFRDNAVKLFDWEYMKFSKVHDLEIRLEKSNGIIEKQAVEIGLLKLTIKKQDERFAIQQGLVEDLRGYIKRQKTISFFGGLINFGLGYATGFASGKANFPF